MNTPTIKTIRARQILDSRGTPTIETKLWLSNESTVVASIPSGESLGKYEAVELRDGDQEKYNGMGVLKAVANVNERIGPKLAGMSPLDQKKIDDFLIELDGSKNKGNLGANAILSVSQAVCEAAALAQKIPIYQHVGQLFGHTEFKMPTPILNLINGGKHGAGNLDFQEFHVLPFAKSFAEAIETGDEIYQMVEKVLIRHGAVHSVGDEGGFAPNLFTNSDALEVLLDAIKESGALFGRDVFLGLDVAATHFYKDGRYKIRDRTMPMTAEQFIEYFRDLNQQYLLYLIEDPLNEDDWGNWIRITSDLKEVFVVGDDLLATNIERTKKAVQEKACSAILIKPNQVGTISETLAVVKVAREAKWKVIVSHRSGETVDDFIADFAVGVDADMVKFGAPARGERVTKYNRLMEIETELK